MADAFLAWRMNGADIPQRHGYPMRVLIPGRYGEENSKWLTRIELTDHFVGGLYSDQGWYNGPLHTMSRMDHPSNTVPVGKAVEIGGIAFAGNRGIQKVEVSTNGGQNMAGRILATAPVGRFLGLLELAMDTHPTWYFYVTVSRNRWHR